MEDASFESTNCKIVSDFKTSVAASFPTELSLSFSESIVVTVSCLESMDFSDYKTSE